MTRMKCLERVVIESRNDKILVLGFPLPFE